VSPDFIVTTVRLSDCLAGVAPDVSPAAIAVAALAGFSAGRKPSTLAAGALGASARAIRALSRVEAAKQILGRLGRCSRSVRCNGRVPWNELVRGTYSVDICPTTENSLPGNAGRNSIPTIRKTQGEAFEAPLRRLGPNRPCQHRRSIEYPYSRLAEVESWAFFVGRILPYCCFKESHNPAIALQRLSSSPRGCRSVVDDFILFPKRKCRDPKESQVACQDAIDA
jgi:hypothetical protein